MPGFSGDMMPQSFKVMESALGNTIGKSWSGRGLFLFDRGNRQFEGFDGIFLVLLGVCCWFPEGLCLGLVVAL